VGSPRYSCQFSIGSCNAESSFTRSPSSEAPLPSQF
jgi:hypothetical protein